jgi:hypothetical protein
VDYVRCPQAPHRAQLALDVLSDIRGRAFGRTARVASANGCAGCHYRSEHGHGKKTQGEPEAGGP